MFQVGDQVYYPMHGIGTVEAIEEQSVLGEQTQYYILRFHAGNMTAMVPTKTAESVGVRSLVDQKTCKDAVKVLFSDSSAAESENWNQRFRDNMEKLRTGDILLVAEVVRDLASRDACRGLSTGERKMYMTAKQILFDELQYAGGIDTAELESKISRKA